MPDYSLMDLRPFSSRVSGWVWLFLLATGVTVAQLLLHIEKIPYTATLATAAVLGRAATTTSRVMSFGFAALTLAAGLIDTAGGGFGWPLEVADQAGPAAIVLILAGAVLLAAGVVRRVWPDVRRRHMWPAGVAAALLILDLGLNATYPRVGWREAEPGPFTVLAVLTLPMAVLILLAVAANAAFAAGRPTRAVAVGLLAVFALASSTVGAVADLDVLHRLAPARSAASAALAETHVVVGGPVPIQPLDQYPVGVLVGVEDPARSIPINVAEPVITPAAPAGPGISWRMSPWQGRPDWPALWPAILASLLLLGLAALGQSMIR